jgi:hypothetical protein
MNGRQVSGLPSDGFLIDMLEAYLPSQPGRLLADEEFIRAIC